MSQRGPHLVGRRLHVATRERPVDRERAAPLHADDEGEPIASTWYSKPWPACVPVQFMKNPFSSFGPATLTRFPGDRSQGGVRGLPAWERLLQGADGFERVSTEDRATWHVIRRAMTDELTIARLFRVPPEEFTVTRKRLIAHLRETGEAASAAEVAKLPRPTPVVWAINQAAHKDRPAVERLLAAASEGLSGRGGGADRA